jgi:hypothetical protein
MPSAATTKRAPSASSQVSRGSKGSSKGSASRPHSVSSSRRSHNNGRVSEDDDDDDDDHKEDDRDVDDADAEADERIGRSSAAVRRRQQAAEAEALAATQAAAEAEAAEAREQERMELASRQSTGSGSRRLGLSRNGIPSARNSVTPSALPMPPPTHSARVLQLGGWSSGLPLSPRARMGYDAQGTLVPSSLSPELHFSGGGSSRPASSLLTDRHLHTESPTPSPLDFSQPRHLRLSQQPALHAMHSSPSLSFLSPPHQPLHPPPSFAIDSSSMLDDDGEGTAAAASNSLRDVAAGLQVGFPGSGSRRGSRGPSSRAQQHALTMPPPPSSLSALSTPAAAATAVAYNKVSPSRFR